MTSAAEQVPIALYVFVSLYMEYSISIKGKVGEREGVEIISFTIVSVTLCLDYE